MIRLPNVRENFMGIPNIIDRHGIETRLEFFEEKKLGEQDKQLAKPKNKVAEPKKAAVPAASSPAIRHQQHPGQQGGCHYQTDDQIAFQTAEESA